MHNWNDAYESGDYREHWDYSEPSAELISFIASGAIPDGGKCIDFGCGSGSETIFISSCGFETVGIDLSKKALEIAEGKAVERKLKISWIIGDVLSTGLESSSFDFINDRGCFHHITPDKRQLYSDETYRILKPGGKILLRGCRENKEPGMFTVVTEPEIDKFFEKSSFSRSPVLPIKLISDAGSLNSNIIVLTKI